MRLSERLATGIAAAAALTLFVAGRYLPEHRGELDRDFPRMTPGQSAWMIGVPAVIVGALVLARRAASDRIRARLTGAVAIASVIAVLVYLVAF